MTVERLAEALRAIVHESEYAHTWIAREAGVSPRTLEYALAGANATIETYEKILGVLDRELAIVARQVDPEP